MCVRISGGPIHAPHKEVLQLLIEPWREGNESWTVYRHEADARKDGKIVFKKWNHEADWKKFRSLGSKEAPKDWRTKADITEKQFPVSGRWVRDLERTVGRLSVPPITGKVQPLQRVTEYRLSFCRGRQRSEFSWHQTPPAAWKPLARLFTLLLRSFRRHTLGKPLLPAGDV